MEYIKLTEEELAALQAGRPHLIKIIRGWRVSHNSLSLLVLQDIVKGYAHLRIRREDKLPIHDWGLFYRIKNDLLGDYVAFEIYPKSKDLVDNSNTYHLWIPLGDMQLPNLREIYTYKED